MSGRARTYGLENRVHEASIAMVEEARGQKSGAFALLLEFSLVVELQGRGLLEFRHGGGCRRLRRTAGRPAQHVGLYD